MYGMKVEDRVLQELHRAASDAGRRGIAIPSADLPAVARRTGGQQPASQAIQRLLRQGRVVRVRKDLLVLPDTTGLLGVDMADLVAAIAPHPYLITGGRALEHHDLTDQHFFGVVVLVPREIKNFEFRGQTTRFLKTDVSNIWGWTPGGKAARYAKAERAIVDVLNHPRYGVSLTQALDGLLLAVRRNPAFLDRLLSAVTRYSSGARHHSSRAAARRVGLAVERLFGAEAAEPFRHLIGANRAPVLMRPGGSRTGDLDSDWRVIVNAAVAPEGSPA